MFDIGEKELLVRVRKYKLYRERGRLVIDIHEVMAGESPHRFTAIPRVSVPRGGEEYFGVGDTELAALKDCLRRIKNVPIEVIAPPPW
jgi:hypothetical protein